MAKIDVPRITLFPGDNLTIYAGGIHLFVWFHKDGSLSICDESRAYKIDQEKPYVVTITKHRGWQLEDR